MRLDASLDDIIAELEALDMLMEVVVAKSDVVGDVGIPVGQAKTP
jgi:hypothetical protein